MVSPADHDLGTIAVDLTPVLPGGENGGAKVFVLELIRRLAELSPGTQFVLLTQAASHRELAALDRANIRRVMVLGAAPAARLPRLLTELPLWVFRHLPERLKPLAGRIGYNLKAAARRGSSATILRQLNADLLFCPFTAPTYSEATTPTVSVIYDLQYKTYPEFFTAEDVAHRDRTFIEASKRSTMLTAISEYSRRIAIERGGLDPGRIKTVRLHISRHSLRDADQDPTILARLDLDPKTYLIYPANFWKHKNHEMLLTAFGMARHAGLAGEMKLICTGAPGVRQTWLKQAAAGLGLGSHVVFPGYLSNPELLALMSNSSGVIFPSLYEGFGLPIIEAMTSGVPVACSNVTSLPEVAGGAAILFDPRIPEQIANAMISLSQDTELTARLTEAGRFQAARFSDSAAMAREYWQIFRQAAGAGVKANMLFGAHQDGWGGPSLTVQVVPSVQARTLELAVTLPDWAPIAEVTLRSSHKRETVDERPVSRGQTVTLSLPLSLAGGVYEMELAPFFVPASTGMGEDTRELTVLISKCAVLDSDGKSEILFLEPSLQ